ncbi:tetratricopeptide repeat protein [Deinococcus yavapaiensis]|uniref:Tetratricopeptide repeat protein n=1 Tax=Deinococcus yavapaiensis KR-236 TaxID=694435 RepID=A0A318SAG2_9DEIO|nr:tetratricopeptide repeat protein [Deinococcus yavapaiensis]PYE55388.1 tetratricopeptide repeat protein [Deinococcus yavapaiensis KR-236]
MNTLISGVLTALLVSGAALAASPSEFVAWSDAALGQAESALRSRLDVEYRSLYGPPPSLSVRAEASAATQKALEQLRATLAGMPPNDPNRKIFEETLAALSAQQTRAATTPAAAPVSAPTCPASLSLATALKNTRDFVAKHLGASDAAKLHAAVTTPEQADRIAAQAVAANRPHVALAALLEGYARDERDASQLVNTAGLAGVLGFPCEALALLDAAGKLPKPTDDLFGADALALNARGYALLKLGRAQEAESVLRRAVTLDPSLSEAQRNLAMALKAQRKDDEAMRFYRLSMRRAAALKDGAATTNPPPSQASGEGHAAPTPTWPAAKDVYDLSGGVGWKLPQLPYPKHVGEGLVFEARVKEVQGIIDARMRARAKRLGELVVTLRTRARHDPGSLLTSARVSDITARIDAAEFDPDVRAGWALVNEEMEREDRAVMFNAFRADAPHTQAQVYYSAVTPAGIYEQTMKLIADAQTSACATRCTELQLQEFDGQRCDAMETATNAWRTRMLRLDGAVAEVFDRTFRLMTGLAGNIEDPATFEFARLSAEQHADILVSGTLLQAAAAPSALWHQHGSRDWHVRCGERADVASVKFDPPPSFACTAKNPKLKFDLVLVKLNLSCEKVAVEVTPLKTGVLIFDVGVYGELEYAWSGRITVGVGVKGGTSGSPLSVGVKGGVYFTGDTSGQLIDVGVKGGVSSGVMIGSAGGDISATGKISFIPS